MAKLTAHEYLNENTEKLVEHVNNSGLQSEIPFFQAVLSARSEKASIRQGNLIIFFTAVVAIATVALVVIPLFVKNDTINQINSKLNEQMVSITKLNKKLNSMEKQLLILSETKNKIELPKSQSSDLPKNNLSTSNNVSENNEIVVESQNGHNKAN